MWRNLLLTARPFKQSCVRKVHKEYGLHKTRNPEKSANECSGSFFPSTAKVLHSERFIDTLTKLIFGDSFQRTTNAVRHSSRPVAICLAQSGEISRLEMKGTDAVVSGLGALKQTLHVHVRVIAGKRMCTDSWTCKRESTCENKNFHTSSLFKEDMYEGWHLTSNTETDLKDH